MQQTCFRGGSVGLFGRMMSGGLLPGLALFALSIVLGQAEVVRTTNSVWSFFRGTNEASTPPTAWRTNDFDDSTWEQLPAPFNYNTNAPLGYGTTLSDMRSNYTSFMLRGTFFVSNFPPVIALSNRPFADDGNIMWLNGVEVRHFAVPFTVGTFVPYNSNSTVAAISQSWIQLNSSTNLLRPGTNLFCIQVFNLRIDDGDSFANPEIALVYADVTLPSVVSTAPATNTVVTNLNQLAVTFSESVTNAKAGDLRINGQPATGVTSNSPTTYTWSFPLPAAGLVQATWNPAAAIKDLAANVFNGTNAIWSFTNVIEAPRVISATPPFGAVVSSLTQVAVEFNRAVTGVAVEDLLAGGQVASGLSGSNTTYTFTFPPLAGTNIQITWDGNHLIVDSTGIRMIEAENTWTYTIVDTLAPTVASLTPVASSIVASLTQVEVLFSEPVSGVDAADLVVNGAPALSAFGGGAGPYVFQFPQPGTGTVTLAWSGGHNIRDNANPPNAFAGGAWNVTLNPSLFTGDVIINEFCAANAVTNGGAGTLDIDEFNEPEDWIELFNRGSNSVRLLGWSLTDNPSEPGLWTLPDVTLAPGNYLVVYASERNRKTLGGTNRLHTSFALNPNGEYLALFNAESPRRAMSEFTPQFPEQRNDYSYGLINSNTWRYFNPPTPGTNNGTSTIAEVVPLPEVNVARGYFQAPFTLIASCALTNATMRYTTDGSEPVGASPVFPGTQVISNTTVLRLAAFAPGLLPSRSSTHSYIFLDQIMVQSNTPPGYPTNWGPNAHALFVGGVVPVDYEMDMDPVRVDPLDTNSPIDTVKLQRLKDGLRELPVISIVMKVDDMFGSAGLYQLSAIETGVPGNKPENKKPCSVEMILPDGTTAFATTCGIDLHGNASRNPIKNPKHGFKLKFRSDFGPGSLDYKLFEDSPVEEYDDVLLRADYNSSWRHPTDNPAEGLGANQRTRGTRTRDAWMKDATREMGGLESHNRFVHVYINGLYWGTYDLSEDPTESFAKNALGGTDDDYDIVDQGVIKNGTLTFYNAMLALPAPIPNSVAQYDAYRQYLDLPSFTDYMLLHFFMGHQDWSTSATKNWAAIRKRVPGPEGTFRYIPWDGECILLEENVNRTTVTPANYPSGLHGKLRTNIQYQVDFGDRVHKHLIAPDGQLQSAPNIARWQKWQSIMDKAIVGESTRWGDYRRDVHRHDPGASPAPYGFQLYTREAHWLPENNRMVNSYFVNRPATVLAQLRAGQLYPNNTAPVFNQHGGRVSEGFLLTMTATNTIYYTTNGVDPRTYGSGAISPLARLYTGAIGLNQSMVVKARMLAGTNWSALNEATFAVASLTVPLRITEIMYNPIGGDAYEFIELQNTGATPLDIGSYNFNGITFIFPFGTVLSPGQRLVLGNNANTNVFQARYPGVLVTGWFGGSLANGGETITVLDGLGRIILSVSYDDEFGWPTASDGGGYSLEIIDPNGDPDAAGNWRASNGQNGTPGAVNSTPPANSVVLNEVMADNPSAVNHEGTYPDWVELYNGGVVDLNVAGWSLTDDGDLRKFIFPGGTTVPAGGYLVVWCDATTNTTSGLHTGFSLGRNGDDVFLYDASTNRVDAISFGPQAPNYSIGRVGGSWELTTPTTNAVNIAAALAPAIALSINEWLANTTPGADDWLELFNSSSNAPAALRNTYLATSNALFQIRSLSFIAPRGFLQLIADENAGPDHLDFKLPASPGVIVLYDAVGAEVQRVNYGSQVQAVTQGRLPDGAGSIVAFPGSASPGGTNYLLNYTGPVLNELLARNSGTVPGPWGNYPDFLELFNPNPTNFNLGGMGLSDDAGEVKFVFAPGTTITANGYLVVWCDGGRAVSTNGTLNSGFSLSSSSGGAYLFNAGGQLVNSVEYGFQVDDRSVGVSASQWLLLSAATPGAVNAAAHVLGSVSNLRINEWMADVAGGNDWFELFNLDPLPVNLSGLYLTDDLSLAGLSNTPIAALSFINGNGWVKWIADQDPSQGRDHAGFDLDRDGDNIRLYAPDFSVLDSVSFGAQLEDVSQGRLPDGGTNVVSFQTTPTPDASNYLPLQDVVINEVLTHTDVPLEDAIEIQNIGTNTVNIGDWFISDSESVLKKFRVATGTTLGSGAFKVFYETNFNAGGNGTNFTLNSAHGDSVYLSQADGAGNLTGYRTQTSFGAAQNGVSFGRFPTSVGVDFVAMAQRTFGVDNPASVAQFRTGTGLTNSDPKIGPVILNEVMYHPSSGVGSNAVELADEEFVELHNVTGSPVPMFDSARPTNGWQLSGGASFTFTSNHTIAAQGYLVLVNFNPATNASAVAAFQAKYGAAGPLVGPLGGRLDNGGEEITLSRPDAPQQAPQPDAGFVPMILVDRVVYGDLAPWPLAADGGGASLQRLADSLYGNEPLNWKAEPATAGTTNTPGGVVAPTISSQPTNFTVIAGSPATFTVGANGSAPLSYQWQHANTNLPGANSSILTVLNARLSDAGAYHVIITNLGGNITSQDAMLTVLVPPAISGQPTNVTAIAGQQVQFNVTAGGTAPLHYQWRFNGAELESQNSLQLTLNNVQPGNAGNYTVVITNVAGSLTSVVAALVVNVPPFITSDPTNQTVLDGGSATFVVSATGTAPLGYQWRKDNLNLPGANGPSHTVSPASAADEGFYSVLVTNLAGQALSLGALLQVSSQPFLADPHLRLDGVFEFTLVGRTNRTYSVEWTADFNGWTNLTNITLTGPQAPVTNPSTNAAARFYRARLEP